MLSYKQREKQKDTKMKENWKTINNDLMSK